MIAAAAAGAYSALALALVIGSVITLTGICLWALFWPLPLDPEPAPAAEPFPSWDEDDVAEGLFDFPQLRAATTLPPGGREHGGPAADLMAGCGTGSPYGQGAAVSPTAAPTRH